MPRRRLFPVVVAGALTVAALAGCRVEPGSAAFVGNTTLSKADLDHIVDQYKHDGGKVDPADEVAIRAELARDEVFVDVASRYASDQRYGGASIDIDGTAQRYGLPPSDPAMQLLAKVDGYRTLLFGHVPAVQPTDAEFHEIYDYLVSKQVNVGSYDETLPQLRQLDGLGEAIAVKRALTDAIGRYEVRLNPLYDSQFVLFTVQGQSGEIPVVAINLSGGTARSGVRDLPAS